ncbi:16S rRNA (uracil(1498)-N(3))-methyltransferase [Pedobacter duraquae]|uniref:Ribosomal RNA small subunit methyltransferase E n=1 Tax=Pedobacter duraquae TaxID=425511 RepID=A0A4R6IEN1_9SPHI|nr:16S rRNA (uracil(1498)-N(3))-methyltransferase [Pedobacter duraquae]TDO20098.1 16S rRNA (uracil1498-N3)-methyltransferase [Pedobacter duraquae]
MHVFYTPDIEDGAGAYALNEEESRHCSKVLRLGIGDQVSLVDGRGGLYQAEIASETKRQVTLKVISTTLAYQKRNHHLHIAVAPTKNIERLEWFLEKATEIGIDEITPIICAHSERKVIKEDRLVKVITAAVKQSLQAYHPQLNPAISFADFIRKESGAQKMIAHCIDDTSRTYISDIAQPHAAYLILIGPEGDFSPAEIDSALQSGFKPLTLGNTRLRTETAALAACFELNYLNR